MYTPTRSTSKTPGSRTILHQHTPKSGFQTTPSPNCNPFEGNLERLKHGIVTPGVFQRTTDSTPDSERKPFKWDIEHKARLNPVDFGDLTEKLKHQEKQSRKVDKQAQDHIDVFFQNEHIAPSPFGEPVPKFNVLDVIEEHSKSRNVSSQTDVHIPLSVDINDLLKDYKLSESQIDELNKGDSFSNSSLRRKLFGNDSSDSSGLNSGVGTPEKENQPPLLYGQVAPSDLLSSSPVFGQSGDGSIATRRCTLTMNLESDRSSPDVSPISSPASNYPTLHRGFQSSPSEVIQDCPSEHIGFKQKAEFHVSNSGLVTDSEDEDDGVARISMIGQLADTTDPQRGNRRLFATETTMQQDMLNDTASMCSTADGLSYMDAAPQTSQSFAAGQSASDTGYQSQITFSTYDAHISAADSVLNQPKRPHVCGNMSPPKSSQGSWEPPSSSTPRKVHATGEDNDSGMHIPVQPPL